MLILRSGRAPGRVAAIEQRAASLEGRGDARVSWPMGLPSVISHQQGALSRETLTRYERLSKEQGRGGAAPAQERAGGRVSRPGGPSL